MFAWFTTDHILAVVAIIFGLIGIIFELTLHKGFEKQKAEVDEKFRVQKDKIEQIVLSVHTSFIGKFPQNLEKTAELILNAKEEDEVRIFVDFLGYGHYSFPDAYERYVRALTESKAKIQILVYDEDSAKASLQLQFKRDSFPQTKISQIFKNYCAHYSRQVKNVETYEEFLNTLLSTQDFFCQQITGRRHIDVRSIPNSSIGEAVFFWLIHRKEMVFAFPNSYTGKKDFSFKTRDDHLIVIFVEQFNTKWANGQAVDKTCYSTSQLFDTAEKGSVVFKEDEHRAA